MVQRAAAHKASFPKGTGALTPGFRWSPWLGPMTLVLLTLAMFGDLCFQNDRVLSRLGTDLSSQFVPWREFGFGQLRNGNLALWNPYLFSGMPYLGGFQSALLYPPNLLHLVLPVGQAVNILIALHVLMGGLFMYFWAARRGLHRVAATLSGTLLMFCGAQFLHIYAGHLPNLYTMAWAPLLFLALDALFETGHSKWSLLGMAALALQILAGHPQYVFYTSVAAGIYWCFRIIRTQRRLVATAGFVAIFVGGAAIAAAQLLTGLDASSGSVRSKGVPYEFAAMFSFPPENLLTLAVPNFFGNMISSPYWGRCYLWEMSLFIGVTGLVLALYGAARGARRLRLYALPMAMIMLILAIGSHTPLFELLYHYVPGFGKFRGSSKFIFQASLFAAMLSGVGLDRLIRSQGRNIRLALAVAGGALTAALAGIGLMAGAGNPPAQWWQSAMNSVSATGESYLPASAYAQAAFVRQAAGGASRAMLVAAGTLVLLAGLIAALRYWRRAIYGIALLGVIEVFIFARSSRVTFELAAARLPQVEQLLKANGGNYRVLNLINPNIALSTGVGDLWGYDPGLSLRYAQFMAFTQKEDPDSVTQYVEFKETNKLYRMLRLRYIFFRQEQSLRVVEEKDPLPRLKLIYEYIVLPGRDEIFTAMARDDFDPARKVILESPPPSVPTRSDADKAGNVSILNSSTDELTIQADLPSPAILLVTDGYSSGWRASALPGSAQLQYQVIPANYVLMAVPLSAGHHLFRLKYAPRAFEIGKWISLASLGAFLLGCTWSWVSQGKRLIRQTIVA